MHIVTIITIAFYLSVVSRWHGGAFVKAPKQVKNFAWSLPFGLLSGLALNNVIAGIIVTLFSMLAKTVGHGGGMDLGHSPKEPGSGRKPEKLEYLILWLHGKISQYWYDALLLLVLGLFSTLGAAVAVGHVLPLAGALIAIGGALKPIAYMIGWAVIPDSHGDGDIDDATEIGELLTGLFAGLGLGLAWVCI